MLIDVTEEVAKNNKIRDTGYFPLTIIYNNKEYRLGDNNSGYVFSKKIKPDHYVFYDEELDILIETKWCTALHFSEDSRLLTKSSTEEYVKKVCAMLELFI